MGVEINEVVKLDRVVVVLRVCRGTSLIKKIAKPPDLDPFPQHLCQPNSSKNARFKVFFELFC